MTIAQRIGQVSTNIETATRAGEFVAIARSMMLARNSGSEAAAFAATPRAAEILKVSAASILKTAVPSATTDTTGWASQVSTFQTLAASFVAGLKGFSAFDTMLPSFISLPLHTNIRCVTLGATGTTLEEAQPIPLTRLTVGSDTFKERLTAVMVVETAELLRQPAGFQLLNNKLKEAVARAIDLSFLTTISQTTDVTSNSATTDHAADLKTAVMAINTGANSKIFAVAPPAWVKGAAYARGSGGAPAFPNLSIGGGDANGVTVIPSDALADEVVVVDASQCVAWSGDVLLDVSGEAAVQMDDDPSTPPQPLRSLWQDNLEAIRLRRYWGFTMLSSDAAAVISGATA